MKNPRFPETADQAERLSKAKGPHDGTDAWPCCECDNCNAWRRSPANQSTVIPRTIAQSIRWSSDPHHAAVTSFTRRDCPHGQNKHIYYFEDGSFLAFEVSYTAVEDGGRS